ncbi:MAG: bifunctional riboflavin kinase/FAD synthetase [Brachymonas sp.]|nr:bifunctional riboflavin kinase/FAD synthetase [Brachymonas sp.]
MKIHRGLHGFPSDATALSIGNFDGVHRGHQIMLERLKSEAQQRGLACGVITFEPHPRDYFARVLQKPEIAPARITTLRDKMDALAALGLDFAVILPFNAALAALSAEQFVQQVLVDGLHTRYLLVGDDFRFGAGRTGDLALLQTLGEQHGFEVACMPEQAANGQRFSSTAVRAALAAGDMTEVTRLLGRPYAISGHVVHGRKLGRELNAPTLNLRFAHWKPAASGIFVVQVHGLSADGEAVPGVANMGIRPSLDADDANGGRVLLETHCLRWPEALGPEGGYGRIIRVELLHKLHDELNYPSLSALQAGIARDCDAARVWFAERDQSHDTSRHTETRRQTTRDRI